MLGPLKREGFYETIHGAPQHSKGDGQRDPCLQACQKVIPRYKRTSFLSLKESRGSLQGNYEKGIKAHHRDPQAHSYWEGSYQQLQATWYSAYEVKWAFNSQIRGFIRKRARIPQIVFFHTRNCECFRNSCVCLIGNSSKLFLRICSCSRKSLQGSL